MHKHNKTALALLRSITNVQGCDATEVSLKYPKPGP